VNAPAHFRFGDPIYRYDTLASTQDVAREWACKGALPGTVVTARSMTAGRGRHGRKWEVPTGANVCLTALCPPVAPEEAWKVALVAGIAVTEAVRTIVPSAEAKTRFPNDIYAKNRKLGGILVETMLLPDGKLAPLLGIGVNVLKAPLSPEIAARAISMEEASGFPCPVSVTEETILVLLTALWRRWREEGFDSILALWRSGTNMTLSRNFILDGIPTECLVTDLSPEGIVSIVSRDGKRYDLPAAHIILGEEP
jgi:BirA family biotin operon repressor/biotin-[acetyl-CoA-carboxylase] ligase